MNKPATICSMAPWNARKSSQLWPWTDVCTAQTFGRLLGWFRAACYFQSYFFKS